jgi:hypothetical protein
MVRFPISDWLDEHGCYAFLLQSLRPDGLCCPRGHGLPLGKHRTCAKVFQYLHGHLRVEGGSETRSAAASRSSAASA